KSSSMRFRPRRRFIEWTSPASRTSLSAGGRGVDAVELKIFLAVVIGDLLFARSREVGMLPQVFEIIGKLAIPVRDVRGVEKMVVADVVDRLRQQPLLGLEAEINLRLAHGGAGFFLQVRRLALAA